MPDRKATPSYKTITSPAIPGSSKLLLDNGIPLHWISTGDQEAIRIECLFPVPSWQYPHPKVSFFGVKMLLEGTGSKSSAEIAQALDLYGAFTEIVHTPDYYGLTVYTMPKFLPHVLPVIAEVFDDASFPQNEWDNLLNIVSQQLKVNQEQNSWLAGSKFKAALFGDSSRYGYSQNETDLSTLRVEEAKAFYFSFIRDSPFYIFASGKVSDASVALIGRYLGSRKVVHPPLPSPVPSPGLVPVAKGMIEVDKPGSSQYTLRMGRKVPGRLHPDYFKALVTNEVLGGYFGSRLMKNIREEKGLTYGISSYLPALRDSAYFMVATDVNKDSLNELLAEIKKEFDILQTQAIPDKELDRVKNVMSGEFARSLGTAFEIGDLHQTAVMCGLPASFYDTYLDNIRAVTVEDVQSTALDLFDTGQMTEVVVG